MKAVVEGLTPARDGGMLVTLRIAGVSPRVHTYRVTDAEYREAGCPVEEETVEGEAFAALTEREDTRLAYERALKILAAGDNTAAALLRKLRERGFSASVSEKAVKRAEEQGYIREEEMLLRQLSLYAKRLWGPRKFLPALLQKGFSRETVGLAMETAAREGIYQKEAVRQALLDEFSPKTEAEAKALLYKYGFF